MVDAFLAMFPAYSRTRHCKNCAPRRTASVKMVVSKKAEFPCRHFPVFVSRAASAAVLFTDTFTRGAGGRILHDIPRVVFHGGHKETAQSAPAHRWCLRANSPACAGTLCLHFRQFVVFRTIHDWGDNLCHVIMRTSEAPATPRRWTLLAGRSRLFLASGPRRTCAQLRTTRAGTRRRWCVVVDIDFSESSAELLVLGRQDTHHLCRRHTPFLRRRASE